MATPKSIEEGPSPILGGKNVRFSSELSKRGGPQGGAFHINALNLHHLPEMNSF